METVTVPESVCIDGEWFAAHWQLQAVDGGSGELLIMASAAELDLVLRMDMELAQDLRRQAGIEKPLPVDEARGELAYLRECAQYAADMLASGWTAGQDWRQAANNAESYLRQTLALDAEQEQTYDVPHACNGVRLADLETRVKGLTTALGVCASSATVNGQGDRLAKLERDVMLHSQRLNGATERLATIERRQEGDAVTFGEHARGLDGIETRLGALEYTVRNLQRLAQSDHGSEAGL